MMAQMWPHPLRDWMRNDRKRRAEIRVYDKLAEVLPDPWLVHYDSPFHKVDPRGREHDGQSDFIVMHPEYGILFIEVKGGGVEYDPHRQWTSTDAHGFRFFINDPVLQAQRALYEFRERLESSSDWPANRDGRYLFRTYLRKGVIFPDCDPPLPVPDWIGGHDKWHFCFRPEFTDGLAHWIRNRLPTHPAPPACFAQDAITNVHRRLAASVQMRVPLADQFNSQLNEQDSLLTGEQRVALLNMDENPRGLVRGAAGTGKTVIALEMCARIAERQQSVLLLCYSSALCQWLKRRLAHPAVQIMTFADLCSHLLGAHPEDHPREYSPTDPKLAALVQRARAVPPPRTWDAIVVDEGQDFQRAWWDIVEATLKYDSGVLQVFYDANQAVYARDFDIAGVLNLREHTLRNNLRNTRAIAEMARAFYTGPAFLSDTGAAGAPPSATHMDIQRALHTARNIVETMLTERVRLHDIAIMLPSEEIAVQMRRLLQRPHCSAGAGVTNSVTVDTIARLKGLDVPVTIMIANREVATSQEHCYVGVTRARVRLFVLGDIAGSALEAACARASNVTTD
jgi:hypothetical protein